MDQKFLSSITNQQKIDYQSNKFGAFTFLIILIFIISILLSGGIFGYKKYLENQISRLFPTLERFKREIELNFIIEATDFNNRIGVGQKILSKRTVSSPIFDFLEKNTLDKVSFSSFSFFVRQESAVEKKFSNVVSMKGVAENFLTLAKQIETFKNSPLIENADFSSFNLTKEGHVDFSAELILSPAMLKTAI